MILAFGEIFHTLDRVEKRIYFSMKSVTLRLLITYDRKFSYQIGVRTGVDNKCKPGYAESMRRWIED